MKLVVPLILSMTLALATAASAQPPPTSAPPAGPLDRTQQVGGWTVSDTGGKPGDDSDREVRLARTLETVTFVLHRSDQDGAGVSIRFSRCDGMNWNSGLSLEGAIPARVAQVRDEIHDAFKDFAKMCPPKAGEEAALLEGFDPAVRLIETWVHDRPFTYPPEGRRLRPSSSPAAGRRGLAPPGRACNSARWIWGPAMRPVLFAAAALAAAALSPVAGVAQPAGDAAFRAMLKEMVETDTSIASGDCTVLATKVAARMTAAGFPAADLHLIVPDGNPKAGNLVAVLPGRDPKAKAVLMLGHIDVVNARREDWIRDPYRLIEEGGQLYGRGVSDMKAQDAIWADNMVRYHAEGYRPARTIKMALTCGEEAASFLNGASWLAGSPAQPDRRRDRRHRGGGGLLDAQERRLALTVMAAEKGGGNVILEVTGPGGHSSLPRPENAIVTLGQAVGRLQGLEFPTELNGFSRAYLSALAPRVDAETGAACTGSSPIRRTPPRSPYSTAPWPGTPCCAPPASRP